MTTDPLYDILVTDDSASRKKAPVHTGVFRYFQRALKAVAYLSWLGNEKHNPGEELGWSWNRSNDHGDCVVRHQMDAGILDEYDLPHEVAVAWRALAQLEVYLVEKYDLPLPPAAYLVPEDLSEENLEEGEIDPTKQAQDRGLITRRCSRCLGSYHGPVCLGASADLILDDMEAPPGAVQTEDEDFDVSLSDEAFHEVMLQAVLRGRRNVANKAWQEYIDEQEV